jgi:hypothetical protein
LPKAEYPWEPEPGFCALNTTNNTALAEALEAIRRQRCPYGDGRCDCKYGLDTSGPHGAGSERTGCPELREMIHRLLHRPNTFAEDPLEVVKRMTDAFKTALERTGITGHLQNQILERWTFGQIGTQMYAPPADGS